MAVTLLCAYAGVLLVISRLAVRNGTGAGTFFVNDRASSAGGVAMSLVVSCVGASATMGMAGLAFTIGTPAFWWLGAGAGGLVLLSLFIARRVRETGAFTMPEMIITLLGRRTRLIVSAVIVIAWTAILAAQFVALSKLLGALLGWGDGLSLGLGFVLVAVHTLGGQAAVIRADRLQFYILVAGLVTLVAWLTWNNPGWIPATRFEVVNSEFSTGDLFRYIFVVGGNYFVCPMLFGRLLSAESAGAARRGGLMAAVGLALAGALIVAVGLGCRGLVPDGTAADAILTTAINTVLPGWLAPLLLLVLVSAVVSSADSCLVTSATVLSYDLLGRKGKWACRGCVLVLGAAGLALILLERSIIGYLFMAYDLYVSGVVMPVFVAIMAGKTRRLRPGWFIAAILAGGAFGLGAAGYGREELSLAGMAVSTLLAVIGAAVSSPRKNTETVVMKSVVPAK
ncbi:MAG: hypothetical protein LIP18_06195 [Planctomycetes bacterium]|nr:hypothetical protein [Planctomycetota bacterium]